MGIGLFMVVGLLLLIVLVRMMGCFCVVVSGCVFWILRRMGMGCGFVLICFVCMKLVNSIRLVVCVRGWLLFGLLFLLEV